MNNNVFDINSSKINIQENYFDSLILSDLLKRLKKDLKSLDNLKETAEIINFLEKYDNVSKEYLKIKKKYLH